MTGRLRDEAVLLTGLSHDSIPRVEELALIDDKLAVFMEYVEGVDLFECLQMEDAEFSPRATFEVGAAVASALHTAHENKVLHRDVKPRNIRVKKTGSVKLIDFGIAKVQSSSTAAERSMVMGTMSFLAPEVFEADVTLDPSLEAARDIYALGAVLYECLVLEPLFPPSLSPARIAGLMVQPDKWHALMSERLARLTNLPQPARALIAAMLSYTPWSRPTAAEVEGECLRLAPACEGPDLKQWCRRNVPSKPVGPRDGWEEFVGTPDRGGTYHYRRPGVASDKAPPSGSQSPSRFVAAGSAVLVAGLMVAVYMWSGQAVAPPPQAVADQAVVSEGGVISVAVADNDIYVEGDGVFIEIAGQSGGVAVVEGLNVRFAHDGGEGPTAQFSYYLRSASGLLSDTVPVDISVTPTNDPPKTLPDSVEVNRGESVLIAVLENDSDSDGDKLSYKNVSATPPQHGKVSVDVSGIKYETKSVQADSDSFLYEITDAGGAVSTGVVNIVIKDPPKPPVQPPPELLPRYGLRARFFPPATNASWKQGGLSGTFANGFASVPAGRIKITWRSQAIDGGAATAEYMMPGASANVTCSLGEGTPKCN